jgi:hypothetical protein
MSANVNAGLDVNIAGDSSGDIAEIRDLSQPKPVTPVSRTSLAPMDEAASVPNPGHWAAPSGISPLTRYLGPMLTVASPAWAGDPVPRMRSLQKKLVEHSLTLESAERPACLAAISVVETAVRLRLRLQQMRMNQLESNIQPSGSEQ